MLPGAVPNLAFLDEVWTQVLALVLPVATPAQVHLYVNQPTLQPNMVVGAFTEATYAGYAAVPVPHWLVATTPGNAQLITYPTSVCAFTATGTLAGQTAYGYWIDDHAGNLVQAEYFPAPVPMSAPGDQINFLPGVGLGFWQSTALIVP
jgi:hypothetical protein